MSKSTLSNALVDLVDLAAELGEIGASRHAVVLFVIAIGDNAVVPVQGAPRTPERTGLFTNRTERRVHWATQDQALRLGMRVLETDHAAV